MLTQPTFKAHFHVEVSGPKTVFLLSEKQHFVLSGRLYSLLAPLLDGHHTVDDIIIQLQGQAIASDIHYALSLLERKGYLTEANPLPTEAAAFWNLLGVDATVAAHSLQAGVTVTSIGIPTAPLLTSLEALGISIDEAGFNVVLTDDYLQPDLARFNQTALQTQRPWLLVKPVGSVLWLGPIFYPGRTGCWECLAQRLRSNREIESFLQEQTDRTTPFPVSRAVLPSTLQTGLNLAATEIAKWLVCPQSHTLEGTLLTFDLMNLDTQRHSLVRRPQCFCCGDRPSLDRTPQPIVLTHQPSRCITDGGFRSESSEQTLRRFEHHISPITGIVRSLVRPFEHELVHAYVVDHAAPRGGNSLSALRQAVRPKSFGKGKTDLQAKLSGLGEAIERYSGSYSGDELRMKGTYAAIGEAIHPNACMLYSQSQYRDRQQWNAQHNSIQWVPDPFDEQREIEWTPVWSLATETFKYLPTAYCYYGYPPTDHDFCWSDTNGNAAGATLEEAMLQGFLELVERDAIALWWYNRLSRPSVDLDSFNDPYLHRLRTEYASLQREFWVLDLTSDLNIPTFAAISRRTNKQPEDILFGFGTHFNAKIALMRAVTEMNQMVFLCNGANPQGNATFSRADMQTWCETATLENQPYLAPTAGTIAYSDYPLPFSQDLHDDVRLGVEIARKHGLEILVLDQTRPDIELNVVKVIVPGLRHFWARFAPGRLYDVPVQLGWLKAPLTEAQLNPIPMFL